MKETNDCDAMNRDDPTPARGNQLMRASSLILASLGFVHDFRTGVLPPDDFRGTPRSFHFHFLPSFASEF